jgi:hypothetical protein
VEKKQSLAFGEDNHSEINQHQKTLKNWKDENTSLLTPLSHSLSLSLLEWYASPEARIHSLTWAFTSRLPKSPHPSAWRHCTADVTQQSWRHTAMMTSLILGSTAAKDARLVTLASSAAWFHSETESTTKLRDMIIIC